MFYGNLKTLLKDLFLSSMYNCFCLTVCSPCMYAWYPWRLEGSIEYPGTGDTGSCETPDMSIYISIGMRLGVPGIWLKFYYQLFVRPFILYPLYQPSSPNSHTLILKGNYVLCVEGVSVDRGIFLRFIRTESIWGGKMKLDIMVRV